MDWIGALRTASGLSFPLLLGAIGGGIGGAAVVLFTWWFEVRATTLRELLAQGLEVARLREAYVLEGPNYATSDLAKITNLPTKDSGAAWLRPVEVRAVLDAPAWNAPAHSCYGFVEGRRAWIVRGVAKQAVSYGGPEGLDQAIQPALLSSQAIEELCGWIER